MVVKVEISFGRVSKFAELLVVNDNLCVLAYVNTVNEGLKSLPISIKYDKLLINLLLGRSLRLKNLPGKHQTDMEIVNLILLLHIPDRELVNDIFQVLQMSVLSISALQKDMIRAVVTEFSSSP